MATVTTEIHVGDIGTIFEITVKDGAAIVNVSSATTKELFFLKPDGTKVTKPLVFKTDGTDGILRYTTTVATDLDKDGTWTLQVHVVISTGEWRSSTPAFTVHKNL